MTDAKQIGEQAGGQVTGGLTGLGDTFCFIGMEWKAFGEPEQSNDGVIYASERLFQLSFGKQTVKSEGENRRAADDYYRNLGCSSLW